MLRSRSNTEDQTLAQYAITGLTYLFNNTAGKSTIGFEIFLDLSSVYEPR